MDLCLIRRWTLWTSTLFLTKSVAKKWRIANFPQYTFWGWSFYKWNYSGSGFLWYGLGSPILDRAFDVWSSNNENYYWEISQAIYSNNLQFFEKLLEKYQITWLLVDGNVISSSNQKILYGDKLNELIASSSKIKQTVVFGKIRVYRVNLVSNPKDFVFLADNLPAIGPSYKWNNLDKAYEEYGDYITSQQKTRFAADSLRAYSGAEINSALVSTNLGGSGIVRVSSLSSKFSLTQNNSLVKGSGPDGNCTRGTTLERLVPDCPGPTPTEAYQVKRELVNQVFAAEDSDSSTVGGVHAATSEVSSGILVPDIYYPFRSLFTGRQQNELEFQVGESADYFSLKTIIPKELTGYNLEIPISEEKEVTEIDENDLSKKTLKYPQILLDGEFIEVQPPQRLNLPREGSLALPYIREGNLEVRVPKINGYYSYDYQPSTINQSPKSCDQFNKGEYKHDQIDEKGNKLLRLTSVGSSNCLDFDLPLLSHDLGYLVTMDARNVEGKSLLFSVINKNSQRADLETYLPKSNEPKEVQPPQRLNLPRTSYFILPPMEKYGLGYTLHFDNISIGRVRTINDLGKITVSPIPYRFLTGLKVVRDESMIANQESRIINSGLEVEHPNPSLYQITVNRKQITDKTTLVLSQSFDSGWHAYSISNQQPTIINYLFPFWTGQEIKDHVLVNNWENGWRFNNETMQQCNNGQCNIIIVYLPQYLEYVGFALLAVSILVIMLYPNNTIKSQKRAIA